jgi:flagellin
VLKVAGKVLDRIGELKTLYADPTKNATDLSNYDSEFSALQAQLTSLSSEKFNGRSLFGTTSLSVSVTEDGNTTTAVRSSPATSPARHRHRCAGRVLGGGSR